MLKFELITAQTRSEYVRNVSLFYFLRDHQLSLKRALAAVLHILAHIFSVLQAIASVYISLQAVDESNLPGQDTKDIREADWQFALSDYAAVAKV